MSGVGRCIGSGKSNLDQCSTPPLLARSLQGIDVARPSTRHQSQCGNVVAIQPGHQSLCTRTLSHPHIAETRNDSEASASSLSAFSGGHGAPPTSSQACATAALASPMKPRGSQGRWPKANQGHPLNTALAFARQGLGAACSYCSGGRPAHQSTHLGRVQERSPGPLPLLDQQVFPLAHLGETSRRLIGGKQVA